MPRILYICSSWPHGRSFGGQLRALHIGRALRQVGDVQVLVVSSEAGDKDALRRTAEEFDVLPPILPLLHPNRSLSEKLRWALDTRYLNLHGCVCPPGERARLDSLLPSFDLVWVLNSRTPNILQRWSWPRAHLDLDDVPSTYLRSVARSTARFAERLKARVQRRLLYRRELRLKQRFATLSVCSAEDKCYLGGGARIHVIPNGFAVPDRPPLRNLDLARPRLGFIGLYSYAPNLDGMRWFLDQCWPTIRQAVPGVRLRLVGKDTDGALQPSEPDVDALGWVADPTEEIATWSAMIVPIRFGGGTRIKIAEAFSRKCPAVATSIGAFGYDVKHGEHLLLADSARDFSSACVALISSPDQGKCLASSAWTAFLERWTWDAIATKVRAAAETSFTSST